MKAIVSAYAVRPYSGSEPGLGWNWVMHLSKSLEKLIVVTEIEFKEEIEEWIRTDKVGNVEFIYVSIGVVGRKLCWNQGNYLFYFFYRVWQLKVFFLLKNTDLSQFDYVHHLNMIGYREPGLLHRLGKPFILGPVGGLNIVPSGYTNQLSFLEKMKFQFKKSVNLISLRSPYVKLAFRTSALTLAANSESLDQLKKVGFNSILINETGLNSLNSATMSLNSSTQILWVGKMVHRKLPVLALDIFRKLLLIHPELKLIYLGDGPQRSLLENKINEFGLCEEVEIRGVVSRDEVMHLMKSSRLLLFTSIDEGTPHAVMEALSCRLPVFAHKSCGMQDVINEDRFLIEPKGYDFSLFHFTTKIDRFLKSKEIAPVVLEKHLWEKKIEFFFELIRTRLG